MAFLLPLYTTDLWSWQQSIALPSILVVYPNSQISTLNLVYYGSFHEKTKRGVNNYFQLPWQDDDTHTHAYTQARTPTPTHTHAFFFVLPTSGKNWNENWVEQCVASRIPAEARMHNGIILLYSPRFLCAPRLVCCCQIIMGGFHLRAVIAAVYHTYT